MSTATRINKTPHYMKRKIIQNDLKQVDCEKELIQLALASRDNLQATGLHIKLDEFSAWVKAIQNNPTTPMPECHT